MTIHSRTHFFAVAARLMREMLVDHARRRLAGKRGGDVIIVGLDEVSPATVERDWVVAKARLHQRLSAGPE